MASLLTLCSRTSQPAIFVVSVSAVRCCGAVRVVDPDRIAAGIAASSGAGTLERWHALPAPAARIQLGAKNLAQAVTRCLDPRLPEPSMSAAAEHLRNIPRGGTA
jgi:hypothetical protein